MSKILFVSCHYFHMCRQIIAYQFYDSRIEPKKCNTQNPNKVLPTPVVWDRQLTTATLRGNTYRPLWGRLLDCWTELGAFDDIAVTHQTNPLSAELAFRNDLFGMGRNILGKAFEAFTDQPKFSSWSLISASIGHCFDAISARLGPIAQLKPITKWVSHF